MIISNCKFCNSEIIKKNKPAAVFCNKICKTKWQRTQKPVSREWLIQKYTVEKLSSYEIAKLVNRNPKRVYEWLVNEGIETRTRAETLSKNAYGHLIKSGKVDAPFKGQKRSPEFCEKLKIAKQNSKQYRPSGKDHWAFGRKGNLSPAWKGGVSPLRQSVYFSDEWKAAKKIALSRDGYKCKKCNCGVVRKIKHNKSSWNLCLHHIKSFAEFPEERCNSDNLVTLCETCHYWVHSRENINSEYIIRKNS